MINKPLRIINRVAKCLFLLFVCLGCVQEKMSICELDLKFSYTYNMQNKELFHEQVEQVRVFFYDSNDRFVGMEQEVDPAKLADKNYLMKVPFSYNEKINKAVVWAGRIADSYKLNTPAIGEDINALFLELAVMGTQSSSNLASLWHGTAKDLSFDVGRKIVTVNLIRSTNHIRFSINGKPIEDNLMVKVVTNNKKYDYNNNIVTTADVTYLPHTTLTNAHEITTLRFVKNNSIMLSVIDKNTLQPITINSASQIDVIDYVLNSKPTTMTEQEYLDREYIWDIDLIVNTQNNSYTALAITINGWTKWFNNTGF